MKPATLALLGALAFPTFAVAQDPVPVAQPVAVAQPVPVAQPAPAAKVYWAAKVGAPIPVASALDGLGPKFSLEAALGYRVNERVAMEFGLGGFNIDGFQPFVNAVGDTERASVILSAGSLTMTGKFGIPLDRFELYGLAGLGIYRIKLHVKLTDAAGRPYADETETDTTVGLRIGGGLAFRVSPKVQLGAEANYVIGNEHTFDETSRFDTLIVAGCLTYSF